MFKTRFVFLAAAFSLSCIAQQQHQWNYAGEDGPEHWAAIDPANSGCASGKAQSPIDIRPSASAPLAPIAFDYKPGIWQVVNNGHTVQVVVPFGSSIVLGDHRYELLQFHFHHPSEEAIAGKHFDMVIHLVHKDAQGQLAVIAILLAAGPAHPVIQALWNNLSAQQGKLTPIAAALDPSTLLPSDQRFYTFTGSLTTPPCTEGVQWFVLKSPLNISPEQERTFAALYPNNARPLQALNGRIVLDGAR